MAKKKSDELQQALEQIAKLTEKISALEQKQQQPPVSKKRERGAARLDVYYVLLAVPSKDLPPQAIACARILARAADANHIPEAEAMQLLEMGKATGDLNTAQESWRVFQYYRAKLIAADCLLMLQTN